MAIFSRFRQRNSPLKEKGAAQTSGSCETKNKQTRMA
jgi:hypothetical protein